MSSIKEAEAVLAIIKEQIGLDLPLISGVRKKCGRRFFTVELKAMSCFSEEYEKLDRYARKYKSFSVESGGAKKAVIILN